MKSIRYFAQLPSKARARPDPAPELRMCKVAVGAGTLYGSLKRMLDAGLVKACDKRIDPSMDEQRRVYYQITGLGKKALAVKGPATGRKSKLELA